MIEISDYKEAVSIACVELDVERLDVFGSVMTEDLGPDSDVDVLVRFDRRPGRLFARYFDLKEQLERIFNRPVDVVLEDSIRNPYFREAIERSRMNVYGT